MKEIENNRDIEIMVHAFYEKVQRDERLGHIFTEVADVDWDHHLPRMVAFWSNLLFQSGRYNGKPFRQHLPLPIKRNDFARWLSLFNETVDEQFTGEKADYAKEMAAKIASAFAIRIEMEKKNHKEQ